MPYEAVATVTVKALAFDLLKYLGLVVFRLLIFVNTYHQKHAAHCNQV